jgi:hypothetical protein
MSNMRAKLLAAGLIVAGLSSALLAQGRPAASAEAPRYSTSDTPMRVLMADPAAKAVLVKHVPSLAAGGNNAAIQNVTLKAIQGYAPQVLTEKVLADIDADLAKLTPVVQPGQNLVAKMTTDEAKVRSYTLPDPLRLANGRPVRDSQTWYRQRRPEILRLYETQIYGRAPARQPGQRFEITEKGTPALNGKAIRRQVTIHMVRDPQAPTIKLVEYLPATAVKAGRKVPVVLMINFRANNVMFENSGPRNGADATETARFPIDKYLDAGIGIAAYNYTDVDPDSADGYKRGIRWFIDRVEEKVRPGDAWGAISAWAWSASRALDYLETDPAVDAKRVAVTGASRLGKTALWAAARDQRFAGVIACCSGKIGATLYRRNYGSWIGSADEEGAHFWTAGNFRQYYDNVDALPVDSHMLLALIAPRPVLLQTGKLDHAADPKGEFLAEVAAGPVYRLLGAKDLGTTAWPPSSTILNDLAYHMNSGGHGMQPGDWDVYLAFLQKNLRP